MIVIDASLANKLFLANEPEHDKATEIFEKHSKKLEQILTPELIFYEVANTLATKTALPLTKVLEALLRLDELNLQIIHLTVKEFSEAVKMAKKYTVSVYDATYAVLAREKKCDLVTADIKFADQVNLPFVKKLSEYS